MILCLFLNHGQRLISFGYISSETLCQENTSKDVEEGIAQAHELKPDLNLREIQMPVLAGFKQRGKYGRNPG